MLTIKQITEDKEGVIKGLEKKHFAGARENIDAVLKQNDIRRAAPAQLDATLAITKSKSREIAGLMKAGNKAAAEEAKAAVAKAGQG